MHYIFDTDTQDALAERAEADAIKEDRDFTPVSHRPEPGHGATRKQGTSGRTYGGAKDLVHIPDHRRKDVGIMLAEHLERLQREVAVIPGAERKLLCPGCYMIALIDAAVWLAENNGQPIHELGRTMERAFGHIAVSGDYDRSLIEEIEVVE